MTKDIINIFEGFRMQPTAIDQYNNGGKDFLEERISAFIGKGNPIDFVMLGYPFKSTNHRDKTIGVLPDLAEEVSLENFSRFSHSVLEVYPHGVNIILVSDGFVFNDLLEETDMVVDAYADEVLGMAKDASITLMSLRDFYPGEGLVSAREKVMTQFGITSVELEQRVLFDPNVNALYRGMIHFMEEELAFKTFPSRNQLHKAAKKLARDMMFRNEAYSNLIAHVLQPAIRLSMHPSTNNRKYSFQLIPGPKAWTSPWHCALLIDEVGDFATIHKKDAEKAGYKLVERNGRPYHYQA